MVTQARESAGSRPCPSAVIAKASVLKRLPSSKLRSMRPGMLSSQAAWTAIRRQPELPWLMRLFISHRKARQILSGSKSSLWRPSRGRSLNKGATAEADALRTVKSPYGFLSAHVLVAASHVPPAFVQSASVLAAVAPAKAGPVKANARASASIETRPFMAFSTLD
jgi:hypothetical protein